MTSQPVGLQQSIRFGEDYELDLRPRRLRRGSHVLKLERIPLEILVLLLEHRDETVTRDQIVSRIWGQGVFLDTDNSIRGAVRKLRQVLKDDAEAPRFIQTITGQGYRFIAPVINPTEASGVVASKRDPAAVTSSERNFGSELDGWLQARRLRLVDEEGIDLDHGHSSETAAHADTAHAQPILSSRRPFVVAAVALTLVCLVVLLAVWALRRAPSVPVDSTRRTVLAILPFENLSGDPDQEFFSDGLTEEMIAQLGKLNRDRLRVIARSSVAKYKGTKLTAKEMGRELNADYLIQGSVRRWSDRVRITVQLIEADNQTDLWTESYDRELKDVVAVQDSVVQSIAGQIHIALTGEQKAALSNSGHTPPEAYLAYLKGRYYWNKRTGDSIEKAEPYFQQAIDRDPTYAAAYSGLADCNSGLAWHGFRAPADALPKAYAAARKAVEIDPQSAEAHASLGLVLSHRWDWVGAEAEFKRALELDPQYANAHHWYGDYLSIKGRHQDAISEARRALELDPVNLMISTWVGFRYYMARDYSAAIQQNRESVELDPNFAAAHLQLGRDYVQAGIYGEGVNEVKKAVTLSGGNPLYTAQLAVALAAKGRRIEALAIAKELEAASKKRYVSPYGLAQIYAALGSKDDTCKWLQAAYDDRAVWMGYLAVDPTFERYRSDQRFQELLRRVGLL
jgi:TolB-like protein/DNA-binding winged helix-turn-helix (wHTH) protein/Flp pilus assembly protein TadD